MPISRRQLAASLMTATHIADRHAIAAFIADPATQSAPNPFSQTSAGAVRQVWRQRAAEFRSFDIASAGLVDLLATVADMAVDEVLTQEILRAGPHTANVFHHGDGCRIVGAALYGRPGVGLPDLPMPRSLRTALRRSSGMRGAGGQLDLFAGINP